MRNEKVSRNFSFLKTYLFTGIFAFKDHPTFFVVQRLIAINNGKTPTLLFSRAPTSKRLEQIKLVKKKKNIAVSYSLRKLIRTFA